MAPKNKSARDDGFVQEYLYIEEYPSEIPKPKQKEKENKEDIERGVIVIDLF